MTIMSRSSSLQLVRLQGKLQLSKREKKYTYIFVSVYYIVQYSNILVISQYQWLI